MSNSPSPTRDCYSRSHKHRKRSKSPDERDERTYHKHRKHKHKERHEYVVPAKREHHRSRSPLPEPSRSHKHHIKQEPPDHHRRPVKHERPDPEYDQAGSRGRHKDEQERKHHNRRREERRRNQGDEEEWGHRDVESQEKEDSPGSSQERDKPDFGLSGKLAEETNSYRGVVIKYNEPEDARKPRKKWRLYPFKGEEALPILHIHRQSAFLLGRDRRVADIPINHPSCSKQHAVFQFRLVGFEKADGRRGMKVTPYIIDLGSANGTYVNNNRIESQRYVELFLKDVVKFGYSSREYVLLHDSVDVGEDEGL